MYQAKDFQIEMLEPGTTEPGSVCHVSAPDNFYIQLTSSTGDLQHIADTLARQSQGGGNPVCHLGDPCAAIFDKQWSRGRVTGIPHKQDQVEVSFVDFGNKEYLRTEEICPLLAEVLTVPVLSYHGCLEGVSCPDSGWAPEHVAQFEDLVLGKQLTVHIVSYDELQDVYHLLLFNEHRDLVNKQFAKIAGCKYFENASLCNGVGQKIAAAAKMGSGHPFSGQTFLPRSELAVGDKVNVSVHYVPSPSEWWCNQAKYAEALESLVRKMADTYGQMGPNDGLVNNLRPGMLCAVFSKPDSRWHRASVEKVTGTSVTLTAVDYGYRNTVPVAHVRQLREEFTKLPVQALRCCLHGVMPASGLWTEAASDLFGNLVGNHYFTATVMAKDADGRLHMSLMDCVDNTNVTTAFLDKCVEARKGTPPPSVGVDMPKYPVLDVKARTTAEVLLSWVNTPGDFYVQLADNQTLLESLSTRFQAFYDGPKAQPLASPRVGAMVAARFSEDGEWYRAVVRSVWENSARVEFVDFGNTDEVSAESLKRITPEFSSLPAQSLRCCLSGVRPLTQGSTWSGDAKEFLDKLTEQGALCTFLNRRGDTYEVRLEAEGKDVAREMISLAVVRETTPEASVVPRMPKYRHEEPAKGQSHKAYVGFLDSVESFYVQLSERMDDLEQMMAELQAFYQAGKGRPVTNLVIGLPCATKYEEDEKWYRAEVRSFTVRDVDVFFVDYGNTQSGPRSSVFQLDPCFLARMEAVAIHCHLALPEAKDADAQYDQFNEFAEEEELDMVIKGKEGSKLLVDLLKEGASLTQHLRGPGPKPVVDKLASGYTPGTVSPGQTVSAYASFIKSPARLWVQLAGCDDELIAMMETLSARYDSGAEPPLSSPSPGQPCVAQYDTDMKWYRASVVSVHGTQVKVQFVDYGNSELVDRQSIKAISAVSMSSPLLALECCLDGFQSCGVSDDATVFMDRLMSEQELFVTFKGPKVVTIKVGSIDVAQALLDKGLGPRQQKSAPPQQLTPPSSKFNGSSSGASPRLVDSRSPGPSPKSPAAFLQFKEALPPSGSAEAIITHVEESSGLVFVQLLSSESQLQQLSSRLQSVFGGGGSPLQGPAVKGMACCAKFCLDQCWYRALVQGLQGLKATVQFVDYGNTDTVPVGSLKSLTPDLVASPKHAFMCRLKGLKSWTAQTYEALSRCGMDVQLNIRFVTSSPPFEIQASVRGQDLLQMMFKPPASPPQPSYDARARIQELRNSRQSGSPPSRQNEFGSAGSPPSRQNEFGSGGQTNRRPGQQSYGSSRGQNSRSSAESVSPRSPPQVVEQVFQAQTPPAGEQAVYVSNISEDGTFCVQLVGDVDAIDGMTAKVKSCPAVPHPSPVVGAACGALYSEDGEWYRGFIQSLSGPSAHVVFVDFGNEETCQVNGLKPLPAHLLTPPLAYLCQVGGARLTPEQQEEFRTASADKEFFVTFGPGFPYDVTVRDKNGANLADTIFRPSTIPRPTVPETTVQAMVAHVGQDGHFFLHLDNDLDAITDFGEEIQSTCKKHTEKLASFDVGQFCFAQFSEDDLWYRAVILSSSGDEVTVFFVDYGNTDTVGKSGLLVLPSAFMARPAWAYECKIPGVKTWTEAQKRKFETMTEGKTMNARFLTLEIPHDVELTLNIGLELEEDEEETPEKDTPANEAAESGDLEQNKETAQEPAERFEEAEEPTTEPGDSAEASTEVVQELAESSENVDEVQTQPEDGDNFEDVAEVAAESEHDVQEQAETVVSEEEFSDVKESPEDPALGEDGGEDNAPKAVALEYPSQTPPALDACIVSHLDEDGTFYLQLVSEDDSREKLSDRLQEECESADSKIVPTPSINLPCCAKFSDDEAWYRATIQKVGDNTVEVLFVDFGNCDDVSVDDLRELTAESLQVTPLAYKCVLEDCDTELVSSRLEEVTLDQTLTVTFSTTETIPYTVNLQLEDGTDISTVLIKPQQASSLQLVDEEESGVSHSEVGEARVKDRKCVALEQGQRIQVTVSEASSPSLFYVQRDDHSSGLEDMSDTMFEHFSSLAEEDGTIDNVAEGQLCACQFGEDGSWYRAVIQSIDSEADTCSLFYVDYGNSETVPKVSVRELPAEFQTLPWQCASCCLAGVRCQGQWSDQVKVAFEDMTANKTMTAEVLSGDGMDTPYLVNVFDQDQSVAHSLLALNFPGVEATDIPPSAPAAGSSSAAKPDKLSLENLSEETVEGGLAEKEEEKEDMEDFEESEQEFSRHLQECPAQETVDELDESEREFSRQLQACTARMESTLVEEARAARHTANSTMAAWEEPSAIVSREEKEDEEEDDFEDAVEAEQDSAEEDGNVSEDAQGACGCVSDGLAELEWLDIHVCVAVSATEFWCQLPSARSILASTTLGIERARTSDTALRDVRVGHLYLVCDPPHTNYRGRVLSDGDDSSRVLVLKLDYGTEERVPATCLHPLAKHQLELPAQAFCCCLGNSDEVSASQEWLDVLISRGEAVDSDLQIKVVGRKPSGVLLVDVQERPGSSSKAESSPAAQEESDVNNASGKQAGSEVSLETLEFSSHPVLQSTILGDTLSQSRMEKSQWGESEYMVQILEEFKDYEVTVTPGGDPDSFYVVRTSATGLLAALDDDIDEEVKDRAEAAAPPEGETLAVNSPCLVMEGGTEKWCRGLVKSSGDTVKVLCVDRGVEVEVGRGGVHDLPPHLLDTPVQAVRCHLADVLPVDGHWCAAALALFTDFTSAGPLKLTACGTSPEAGGAYQVTLRDEDSEGEGRRGVAGVERSVNRSLVELGYGEAVSGSPLDLALQVERTINDPTTMEQMETSFAEQSLLRENSLGEESEGEDAGTEQERHAIQASGDAPSMATESDEESQWTVPASGDEARLDDRCDGNWLAAGWDREAGERSAASDRTDNSSIVTVCTTLGPDSENVSGGEGGGGDGSMVTSPLPSQAEKQDGESEHGGVGGESEEEESEETMEEYVSADGLSDFGEGVGEDEERENIERENAQGLAVDAALSMGTDHEVPADDDSVVHTGGKFTQGRDEARVVDPSSVPMRGRDAAPAVDSEAVSVPTQGSHSHAVTPGLGQPRLSVDSKETSELEEDDAKFLDFSWERVETDVVDDRGENLVRYHDEENRNIIVEEEKKVGEIVKSREETEVEETEVEETEVEETEVEDTVEIKREEEKKIGEIVNGGEEKEDTVNRGEETEVDDTVEMKIEEEKKAEETGRPTNGPDAENLTDKKKTLVRPYPRESERTAPETVVDRSEHSVVDSVMEEADTSPQKTTDQPAETTADSAEKLVWPAATETAPESGANAREESELEITCDVVSGEMETSPQSSERHRGMEGRGGGEMGQLECGQGESRAAPVQNMDINMASEANTTVAEVVKSLVDACVGEAESCEESGREEPATPQQPLSVVTDPRQASAMTMMALRGEADTASSLVAEDPAVCAVEVETEAPASSPPCPLERSAGLADGREGDGGQEDSRAGVVAAENGAGVCLEIPDNGVMTPPGQPAQAETRGKEAETHGQEAETHGQETETRGQEAETRGQEAETHGQEAETHGQEAETRGKEAETHGQGAETCGQEAETHGQEAETHGKAVETHGKSVQFEGKRKEETAEEEDCLDSRVSEGDRPEHLREGGQPEHLREGDQPEHSLDPGQMVDAESWDAEISEQERSSTKRSEEERCVEQTSDQPSFTPAKQYEDKEGVVPESAEQQMESSVYKSPQHLFGKPVWKIDPIECPLPSSDDDSSFNSSLIQDRLASPPSVDVDRPSRLQDWDVGLRQPGLRLGQQPERSDTTHLDRSMLETPSMPDSVPESPSKSDSVPESPSKPVSVPESPSKPVSVPENLTKPVSVPESLSKPVSVPESPSKPVSVPESLSKPVSVPESPSKPDSFPESPSKPVSVVESPSKPGSFPESPVKHDSIPESPVKPDRFPESPVKPDSFPESPSKPDSFPESPSKTDSVPESPSKPDSFPESLSKPDSFPESLSKPDSFPESPGKPDGGSCEVSSSEGSDLMEEVAARLESMAVREMQRYQEEEEEQRLELARMIDELARTVDIGKITSEGKEPSSSVDPGETGEDQPTRDVDPISSTPDDHETVSELVQDTSPHEEGWLLNPSTADEAESCQAVCSIITKTAATGDGTGSAAESVDTCDNAERPEAADAAPERTGASDAVGERPRDATGLGDIVEDGPGDPVEDQSEDTMESRPEDSTERPKDAMEGKLGDTMESRVEDEPEGTMKSIGEDEPEDTMESRPENIMESRIEDTMESRPEGTMESRIEDTMESRPESTMESRPEDTVESRSEDTVESRPEDTMESRIEDTMESRPESTMESRPEDTVESRSEDTVESWPEDTTESRPELAAEDRPEDSVKDNQDSDAVVKIPADIVEDKPEHRDTAKDGPEDCDTAENVPQDTLADRPEDTVEERDPAEDRPGGYDGDYDDDEAFMGEEGEYSEYDTLAELSGAGDSMAELTEADETAPAMIEARKALTETGAGDCMAELKASDLMSAMMEACYMTSSGASESMADITEAGDAFAEMMEIERKMRQERKSRSTQTRDNLEESVSASADSTPPHGETETQEPDRSDALMTSDSWPGEGQKQGEVSEQDREDRTPTPSSPGGKDSPTTDLEGSSDSCYSSQNALSTSEELRCTDSPDRDADSRTLTAATAESTAPMHEDGGD